MIKTMIRKSILTAAAVLLILTLPGCGKTDPKTPSETSEPVIVSTPESSSEEAAAFPVSIKRFNSHGNVILDITFEQMEAHNIAPGDILTVFAGDKRFDIPAGTSYSDVDTGQMMCRFDTEDKEVGLVMNMGSFAAEAGIAEKQKIDEDPGYRWDVKISDIKLALKEKEGYLDEYKARNLERSNDRKDYPSLTDEEYANFRAVRTSGIKENWVFRSSTPLDAAIGRNEYAMAAMEKAGIRSVINLYDPEATMKGYDTYPGSYYSRCAVVNPEMSYDYTSEAFAGKVRQSVLFMIENDGPYLIHCKEGKDRTGILCAVLECFAGASSEEIKEDYMLTYSNFYNVSPGSTAYDILLRNLVKPLGEMLGTEGIDTADLKEKARGYLLSAGLTEEQLEKLENRLK